MAKKSLIITDCICYTPVGWGCLSKIDVKYNGDNKWILLKTYLTDEISVKPEELINMTREEAIEHIRQKVEKFWKKKETNERNSRQEHGS